jgi:hypothetical protein
MNEKMSTMCNKLKDEVYYFYIELLKRVSDCCEQFVSYIMARTRIYEDAKEKTSYL